MCRSDESDNSAIGFLTLYALPEPGFHRLEHGVAYLAAPSRCASAQDMGSPRRQAICR